MRERMPEINNRGETSALRVLRCKSQDRCVGDFAGRTVLNRCFFEGKRAAINTDQAISPARSARLEVQLEVFVAVPFIYGWCECCIH